MTQIFSRVYLTLFIRSSKVKVNVQGQGRKNVAKVMGSSLAKTF